MRMDADVATVVSFMQTTQRAAPTVRLVRVLRERRSVLALVGPSLEVR